MPAGKSAVPYKINSQSKITAIVILLHPAQSASIKNNYVQIKIIDNGIGFENQYAEKIFEVFQRLQQNDVYEGTGIGLALCKKIVESHKGTISAESTGNGSTFIIILPVKQIN